MQGRKNYGNPVENFCKIQEKLACDILRAGKYDTGDHNLHTIESTADMPVKQVSLSHSKNILTKWPKKPQNLNFDLLLIIKTGSKSY